MQRRPVQVLSASRRVRFSLLQRSLSTSKPIIQIKNGTFYRQHPSSKPIPGQEAIPNPPLFSHLNLSLPSSSSPNEHWAILSPSSTIRTTFLQILRGQFLCFPPTARSFPYLLSDELREKNPNNRTPERAIEYVGFDVERRAFGGAYLSARYESRVEVGDFTLGQYLTGITSMNPGEDVIRERTPDEEVMRKVVRDLELERFFDKPVSTLSNGQSRRARIGKALLTRPEMLCLDAPFIGLDPFVSKHISQLLHRLAEARAPRIVLSLRPQDTIPDWITHIVYASQALSGSVLGPKEKVVEQLKEELENIEKNSPSGFAEAIELREVCRFFSENGVSQTSGSKAGSASVPVLSRDGYEKIDKRSKNDGQSINIGAPVVEMEGVQIRYGNNSVLGDWKQHINGTSVEGLWWNVHQGQRWGIFGANGSGKTTLISLVTSDHPQAYSAPVKIFQNSRLPAPGTRGFTIFEIQSRMGHSSPEVHALFPKGLSLRRTLETAWSDTPIMKPNLDQDAEKRVEACLRWFKEDLHLSTTTTSASDSLDWATSTNFGELPFSAQRVLLFLRATIRNPEIVILDEAFSGMDDLVRDKCLLFLTRGEKMSLEYTEAGSRPVESKVMAKGQVVFEGLNESQALLCVSHSKQEVPGCVRNWVCLPEPGTGPPRFGTWNGPLELDERRWGEIWDWPQER
ncbi:hypothetical protein K504DRAFT_392670 [Pleomassaria siparia CBS 279.74]|uniref:ABC transporter domain-containing protein n=1 Tax=Pleomassaria siparia CBS 279.74 TaxID=1314801 RepID=A0A6G1JSM5_9PLEO|nr:hypothetical protein K504DRAFT_392670 [Pleomassaria siparia CBS 279.74]